MPSLIALEKDRRHRDEEVPAQLDGRLALVASATGLAAFKIGSFRIDKQLPNFLFLSAKNRKAWAHIMPCDAYWFLRDLENPVRRCSVICMQKHRLLPKKLSGSIHN